MEQSPRYIVIIGIVIIPALAVGVGSLVPEQAVFFYLSCIVTLLVAMHDELSASNR